MIRRREVCGKSIDFSEEYLAFMFKVEYYSKEETSMEQAAKQRSFYCISTSSSETSVDFQRTA
jgi:hypothetical protein